MPPDQRWPPRGVFADRLLAAVLAGAGAVEAIGVGFGSNTVLAAGLCIAVGACVAWRRVRPLVATAAGMGAYTLLAAADVDGNDLIVVSAALMVLVYSVAMWARRLEALAGLGLALLATSAVVYGEGNKPIGDYVYVGALVAAAWGVGRLMRARLLQVAALARHAARAEVLREREAAAAVAEERRRIARELHDIVSHGLSVMVVQAAAAEPAVDDAPDAAKSALQSIQVVGREAQTEMVRMLGVLREHDREGALAPMPAVDDIAALVERTSAIGMPVALSVVGEIRPLPAGVGLAAYRIVQEALTNVRRHAGGAPTEVELAYTPSSLRLLVANRPGAPGAVGDPGTGMGLVGMRERAAMCGGTISAGPCDDGGFVVTADLPTQSR